MCTACHRLLIELTVFLGLLHSYSEELGKWMEVGNSGVFRPEMLRPMGLPEDVNVIAWGLSLERCAFLCSLPGC